MEHVLICCRDGVLYAGELLQAYSGRQDWIGIKPSSHSKIRIYFSAAGVEAIYEQNGSKITPEKQAEGAEAKPENQVKGQKAQERGNVSAEGKRVALIRTPGGVSFRGYLIRETEGLEEYVLAVTEACDKIVCIPPAEVERIFVS